MRLAKLPENGETSPSPGAATMFPWQHEALQSKFQATGSTACMTSKCPSQCGWIKIERQQYLTGLMHVTFGCAAGAKRPQVRTPRRLSQPAAQQHPGGQRPVRWDLNLPSDPLSLGS